METNRTTPENRLLADMLLAVADEPMMASVFASCLTYAQRDVGEDAHNDAIAGALVARLSAEGWTLARFREPMERMQRHAITEAMVQRGADALGIGSPDRRYETALAVLRAALSSGAPDA